MLKRPSQPGNTLQSDESPEKRAKIEATDAGAEPGSLTQTADSRVQLSPGINSTGLLRQDPDYYFEDGNIIFQVENMLFKVHKSLLKRHSIALESGLSVPQNTIVLPESGRNCDETPITIPDTLCCQFRHLLRVIYCQPTDQLFLPLPSEYIETKLAARDFIFYLDVARLSSRFTMGGVEIWARERLDRLAHMPGACVLDGFLDLIRRGEKRDERDASGRVGQKNAAHSSINIYGLVEFPLMEAVQYAREISDSTLHHDCLHLMMYIYDNKEAAAEFVLSFLRMPQLREKEPSLFGYFFLLLLSVGNGIWMRDMFTQMDRMALFSAQSFLTPLPPSLKTPTTTPLFTMPNIENFTQGFSDDTGRQSCANGCYRTALYHWEAVFESYYKEIADRDPRIPITALTTLPALRRRLSKLLQKDACPEACDRRILAKTDQAIEDLYARLADYYKPIY